MLAEFLRAFFLVFLAEMGDKTQIMTMTFAIKYSIKDVLAGIVLGVFINHGIAIALGKIFSKIVPVNYIQLIGGFLFLIFAYLTLLEDEEDSDEIKNTKYGPILTVGLTFFLCELGDKSQLTAMTLAANGSYPVLILLGTTLGMVSVSGFSIFIGSKLGDKIPDLVIQIMSSVVFFIFGFIKMVEIIGINRSLYSNMIFIVSVLIEVIMIVRLISSRRGKETSIRQEKAELLYKQTNIVQEVLSQICLGEEMCKKCDGDNCLVGYMKNALNEARLTSNYNIELNKDMDSFKDKDYDAKKVSSLLDLINEISRENNWPKDESFIVNKIFHYLKDYLRH